MKQVKLCILLTCTMLHMLAGLFKPLAPLGGQYLNNLIEGPDNIYYALSRKPRGQWMDQCKLLLCMLAKLSKSLAPLGCHYHIDFSQGTWQYYACNCRSTCPTIGDHGAGVIEIWYFIIYYTMQCMVYQCILACTQFALERLTIVSALLCHRQSIEFEISLQCRSPTNR